MQKRVSSYHIVWNDFQSAIEYYTKAIELDPNNHVFYSNRAACYISLHQYNKALADSRRSIKINPKFVRAYQRKANALAGLFKYDEAIAAVGRGLKIEPNNDDLKNLAKELKIRLEQQKRNPHQKEPATPTTDLAILASTATPGSEALETLKLLLASKIANVNEADENGLTALHWAVLTKKPEAVKVLLENGADVNSSDQIGFTPLFYCTGQMPNKEITQILLAHGANVQLENHFGNTGTYVLLVPLTYFVALFWFPGLWLRLAECRLHRWVRGDQRHAQEAFCTVQCYPGEQRRGVLKANIEKNATYMI
eukprot:GEZU01027520.1.p1 GENE.GEZU01027520.1~~GEZU01027520.1.p1  ORF type:complete len:310 (+),score=21.70 GEZU01027520.1:193-1122(+)